ncbi:DNA-processing protein DprA [Nocardioides marmoriginsengisoli]|uniref:DNA-processing protein DprA n=1 Tax=Nocardioides marmoriginsengisoli TaxID=661483 RepID=A0A3N0CNR7_9ACTN|nr:DNA-processing protein DprA [Nocardioides marmoriginsengisoli]RNL65124.1 DNA-processing protein DprA [Nocardioides marmoriginsengisoli]
MSTAEREARLLLSLIGEPGDPRLTGLVADLGASRVLAALRDQDEHGELRDSLTERLRSTRVEDVVAAATRRGIRFVTPLDDEWPVGLDDLGNGPVLHERGGVPIGLWVRGPLRLDEACAGSVAVVGARSATTYGTGVAGEIGAALAEAEVGVVSGAAFGIDQAAHRGALAVRGPSVAVLACGVDRAYPAAHAELLRYLADVGLVVSEAAPGWAPMKVRFLARNRLIAALTRGTVVVEAAVRSGALNTANWASGLSRLLMGVPGPVTSATSQGVHQLIRARDALLVTRGAEVLEAVSAAGAHTLPSAQAPADARDRLTHLQRQVLDAVPVAAGASSRSIARTAGLTDSVVREALGRLDEAGFVERAGGRWRLRSARYPPRLPGMALEPP